MDPLVAQSGTQLLTRRGLLPSLGDVHSRCDPPRLRPSLRGLRNRSQGRIRLANIGPKVWDNSAKFPKVLAKARGIFRGHLLLGDLHKPCPDRLTPRFEFRVRCRSYQANAYC
jgi:hypothetical protein